MTSVNLKVDHREQQLKDILGEEADYANLECGDIIVNVDEVPLMTIERKTVADLAASIKDGRYKNQKCKLFEQCQPNRIYYIIEGHLDFFEMDVNLFGLNKKTLVSSIINTIVRDNIKIVFTKNIQETASFLRGVLSRIKADPAKYLTPASDNGDEKVIVKSKPKDKLECYEQQLCQIPDISSKTARAIIKMFPSWKTFYEKLNNIEEEERIKILKGITIQDNKGKERKISERVVKNIIEYLF